MCKSEDKFVLNDERLLHSVTGLGFDQLESLEQVSLVFQFCASKYFDWNHLPSGPYWVRTENVAVTGVVDKVLAVYRDRTYVEIKFAITLPRFKIDHFYSHLKNPTTKLVIFNLVLQISGKISSGKIDKSVSPDKTEVNLYIKATTDTVFDETTSDIYCIDTAIQLPNGKIVGEA